MKLKMTMVLAMMGLAIGVLYGDNAPPTTAPKPLPDPGTNPMPVVPIPPPERPDTNSGPPRPLPDPPRTNLFPVVPVPPPPGPNINPGPDMPFLPNTNSSVSTPRLNPGAPESGNHFLPDATNNIPVRDTNTPPSKSKPFEPAQIATRS